MDSNFISNIDKRDVYKLIDASKMTNTKIKVQGEAVGYKSTPLKGLKAVYTLDATQDHSDMWIKYHELKNDYHARKILSYDYLRPRYERY